MTKQRSKGSTAIESFFLEVPATPESVGQVRRRLAEFTHYQAWPEEDAADLLLAVGEACNNAVNYGGKDFTNPILFVLCRRLTSDALQVDIRNQGNGFHPNLEQLGQLPDFDDFATHGRGFGLMLALVDDVQVLSDGGNTIVRLTKSRAA